MTGWLRRSRVVRTFCSAEERTRTIRELFSDGLASHSEVKKAASRCRRRARPNRKTGDPRNRRTIYADDESEKIQWLRRFEAGQSSEARGFEKDRGQLMCDTASLPYFTDDTSSFDAPAPRSANSSDNHGRLPKISDSRSLPKNGRHPSAGGSSCKYFRRHCGRRPP